MPAERKLATARDTMLMEHYPLARTIACKIYQRLPDSVDLDDLISAAVTGLIEAIDRYDDRRENSFVSYAKHRIHGAVVDNLRADDWVPRSVRKKANTIASSKQHLRDKLGRSPTRQEIAAHLEMNQDRYDSMEADSQIRQLLSLDTPVGDSSGALLADFVTVDECLISDIQRNELRTVVIEAIENLPRRERTAVSLYYLHELSLVEVGTVLGVSESRACQLRSQGIKRLKIRLKNH
jgi:RNA polymerase sigma factor for flagellar operon FliA